MWKISIYALIKLLYYALFVLRCFLILVNIHFSLRGLYFVQKKLVYYRSINCYAYKQ